MNYDIDLIETSLRDMLCSFPLYDESYHVGVVVRNSGHISYAPTDRMWKNRGQTQFALQVDPEVCYILSFAIEEKFWRQGHGTRLIGVITDFVFEEFDVGRVVTTPSGMAKEKKFYESCGFKYFNRSEVERIIM